MSDEYRHQIQPRKTFKNNVLILLRVFEEPNGYILMPNSGVGIFYPLCLRLPPLSHALSLCLSFFLYLSVSLSHTHSLYMYLSLPFTSPLSLSLFLSHPFHSVCVCVPLSRSLFLRVTTNDAKKFNLKTCVNAACT